MANDTHSVRSLARLSGFSKATVANALRGDPSVAAATAHRIRALAEQLGYRHNPIVSTVMSAMRRAKATGFHGVLACIDISEPGRPEHGPFHRELVKGAVQRAADMGYKIESFVAGPAQLSLSRLEMILKTRGIAGVILLPSFFPADLSGFDWSAFSAVSADRMVSSLQLHAVCCDHYGSVLALLETLYARGYRRPGLVMETGRDARVMLRMSAAYRSFHALHPGLRDIPVLELASVSAQGVMPWLRRHKPDLVLSHHTDVLDGLLALGLKVPDDCGFVCLNLAKTSRPCAGLDLQPHLIGARCVESLIGQLQRNERGIPQCPSTLTLPARFIDGPTARQNKPVRKGSE